MNYIIFGGSGFIGTHLIHLLKAECVNEGDEIYDLDIVMPGEEGVVPGIVEKNEGVHYLRVDVRKPIKFKFTPTEDDIIFNLAAVHRTPGHKDKEYFETNITSRGRTGYELAILGIPAIAMAQNEREEKHGFVSNENGFTYIGLNPDDEIIESNLKMYLGLSKKARQKFQDKLLSHDLRGGRKRVMGLINSI